LSGALRYVEILIHYNNHSTLIGAFDNDVLVVAEGGNGLAFSRGEVVLAIVSAFNERT